MQPWGERFDGVKPYGSGGALGEPHKEGDKLCNCLKCCNFRRAEFQIELERSTDLQERLKAQGATGRTGTVFYPLGGRVMKFSIHTGEIEDVGIASVEFEGNGRGKVN
jgi:hypothetical protein